MTHETYVEGDGLGRVLLLELNTSDAERAPHLDCAARYFNTAHTMLVDGRYPERIERVRRTLKFMGDLGAHPETIETTRADAMAALHMTATLLEWYSRPTARGTT